MVAGLAWRKWFAASLVLLLGACAQHPLQLPPPPVAGVPEEFPEQFYRQVAAQGKPVFRVDPADSVVVIEVRRAGSLASLGHDHVVASRDVGGYAAPSEGRADLYVPLARLTVDEPALRAEAGFTTQPTQDDITGTRAHMLDKVLEAERFPFAVIHISGSVAGTGNAKLKVALTLHGATRTSDVPVQVDATGDHMTVAGRLSFDQTDFGITPYSILGGKLAVKNGVDLRFRLSASRLGSSD